MFPPRPQFARECVIPVVLDRARLVEGPVLSARAQARLDGVDDARVRDHTGALAFQRRARPLSSFRRDSLSRESESSFCSPSTQKTRLVYFQGGAHELLGRFRAAPASQRTRTASFVAW